MAKKKKDRKNSVSREPQVLSNGFMAFSLIGCIASLLAYDTLGPAWSISFATIFGFMVISSIVSVTPSFPKYK